MEKRGAISLNMKRQGERGGERGGRGREIGREIGRESEREIGGRQERER